MRDRGQFQTLMNRASDNCVHNRLNPVGGIIGKICADTRLWIQNVLQMNYLFCAAIVLILMGCKNVDEFGRSPAEQIEALKAKVEKLEGKIARIETKFDEVAGSALRLGNEVEDFSSENWRKNVLEVEYEFEQLRQAGKERRHESCGPPRTGHSRRQ